VSDTMIETEVVAGELGVPVVWDAGDEQLLAQLAGRAAAKGLSLAGEGGFLQQMTRLVLQAGLEAEMTSHLGYDKVDKWLAERAGHLSTRSLQGIRSCLNQAINRAMARDKVKRNVALCSVPKGRPGRPSRALTFAQAEAVLKAAESHRMYPYIVLSLLTGARTE
jgi:hypothetical protein